MALPLQQPKSTKFGTTKTSYETCMITRLDQMNMDILKLWQKKTLLCHSLIMISGKRTESYHCEGNSSSWLGPTGRRQKEIVSTAICRQRSIHWHFISVKYNTIIHQPELLSHSGKLPPYIRPDLVVPRKSPLQKPRPKGAQKITDVLPWRMMSFK